VEPSKPKTRRKKKDTASPEAVSEKVENRIVSLLPDEYEELRKRCFTTRESMNYVMRAAIRAYLGMKPRAAPKRGPKRKAENDPK
jgi:hypothetical protein